MHLVILPNRIDLSGQNLSWSWSSWLNWISETLKYHLDDVTVVSSHYAVFVMYRIFFIVLSWGSGFQLVGFYDASCNL